MAGTFARSVVGPLGLLVSSQLFVTIISTSIVYLFFVTSPQQLKDPPAKTSNLAAALQKACAESNAPAITGLGEDSHLERALLILEKALQPDWSIDCPVVAGVTKELEKAHTEIQSRLNQEGQWFYLKYLFAGALTAAFLFKVFFQHEDWKAHPPDRQLDTLSSSPAVAFVLALATVVAVSVDLQIISGRMVIEHLGLWIKHYVEPALLHDPRTNAQVIRGWESLLWDGDPQHFHANSLHQSMMYAHTSWPNIFYITLILYGSFIYIILRCPSNPRRLWREGNVSDMGGSRGSALMVVGYWLLHITLLVAAISGHYVPSNFEVIAFPLLNWLTSFFLENAWPQYNDPNWTVLVYLSLWIILIILHWSMGVRVFSSMSRDVARRPSS